MDSLNGYRLGSGAVETSNRVTGEQADFFGSASRVLVCRLWTVRPAISTSSSFEIVHRGAVDRIGTVRKPITHCQCGHAKGLGLGRVRLQPRPAGQGNGPSLLRGRRIARHWEGRCG
jgi:hypothetical protein